MSEQTSYPLSWPMGWKRAAVAPQSPPFGLGKSMDSATAYVLGELRRMRVHDATVVISTNIRLRADGRPRSDQPQPMDRGVAVYFQFNKKPSVLACDRWSRVEYNLWAIARHIEAMRLQQRGGVGTLDQAFAGYAALPAPGGLREWWVVLGVDRLAPMDKIKATYRDMARTFHPDAGGTQGQMAEINDALARAKFERGER